MANRIHSEQIKLVFFDIDDTLYVKHKDHIPPSVYSAIRQLKARGIQPAIATGRTRSSFPRAINELIEQERIEILVTINGQHTSYQGQVIQRHPIERSRMTALVEFFEQHGITYGFVSNAGITVSDICPNMQAALNPVTTRYTVDKHHYQHHEVYQMLGFYEAHQDALMNASGILGDDLRVLRWHQHSVDILDHAGSKARGIDAIARHLGYGADQIMAFGDGINDTEMLSHVGVGVAMGNAIDELKQVADYITTDIEDDGIFNALVHLGVIEAADAADVG